MYVAPNGSDNNDGTYKRPFKTLERARDAIRALGEGREFPVTVYLREGTYELTETFTLDRIDSGTQEKPIEYRGYPGEVVKLTGAKVIDYSAFRTLENQERLDMLADATARGKVLVADLAELGLTNYGTIARRGHLITKGIMPQMELLVNGERMTLARWPNSGFTTYSEVVRAGTRSLAEIENGAQFKVDYQQPLLWNNVSEIFVSGVLGPNYSYDYYPIGGISKAGGAVDITLSEGAIVPYYSKHFFYYENIFEEIDMEGEYYIDREHGKLYFYPPEGFGADSDVRVTYMEQPLISVLADHITLSNLRFEGGRSAAVSASSVNHLNINNCEIRSFAGRGINISNSTNSRVYGCRIDNIGTDGIAIGGGDYVNIISGNNIVENNVVSRCSYIDRAYTTGILLSYRSVGAVVRNNKIYDMPHAAMIVYGPEHQIIYNEIFDAVKEFHDMDAIYMNTSQFPWERGVVFKWNYIHDLGRQVFPEEKQMNITGIRSDNGGHGITVYGNVFAEIGINNANNVQGVCALGTRNIIKNNIFVNTSGTFDAQRTYNESAVYDLVNNDKHKTLKTDMDIWLPVYGIKYPELLSFFDEHPQSAPKTNVFENNLIVGIDVQLSTAGTKLNDENFSGAKELVNSNGNYRVTDDPGFVDYSGKNFALKSDSSVFENIPGFVNIPFEKIGVTR